jgi:protein-tyrosine phosphatase
MRICFVCLGNICRSPTAEGVFRKLVEQAGLADVVVIDSAGTGGWHAGELPDSRSSAAAKTRGYNLVHRARKFTAADFGKFDLILTMDRSNYENVMQLARGRNNVPPIKLLREFDKTAPPGADGPDPYSGEARGFEDVLDICERACRGLLDVVRERI